MLLLSPSSLLLFFLVDSVFADGVFADGVFADGVFDDASDGALAGSTPSNWAQYSRAASEKKPMETK